MKQVAPILVSLASNEACRRRAKEIKAAIIRDDHFSLEDSGDCPFDLCFRRDGRTVHVELKDFTGDGRHQSDYVASIVSPNGHLYRQILAARELQDPLIIVVLGDDTDVFQAIARMVLHRGFRGLVVEDRIAEYAAMVEEFEASCIAVNVQIWRLKANPWRRMLLNVRKILQGDDLRGFRPRPAEGERQSVGLSILCGDGVGPRRAGKILERFNVSLIPKEADTYLDDCPGIGMKLAAAIQDAINVDPACVTRPKLRLKKGNI